MIKLIASDLDGTLLNEKRQLPESTFALIEKLHEKGILFAPASGRQCANLKQLFAPVQDKIAFICENGALVTYQDNILHLSPVPDGEIVGVLEKVRAIPHLFPLLCGTHTAYLENEEQPFYGLAKFSYTHCQKVDKLEDVIGKEPVCKIAVFDELGAANHCFRLLPQQFPRLRTILSGENWCDVSSPLSNKGLAVEVLRKAFGFEKQECMAFGDHMNDYEMLLACGEAFVTENAYAPLKKLVKRTIPSNVEEGVIQKINEILAQLGEN